jgi:phospholipid transport system substrate-binding protein
MVMSLILSLVVQAAPDSSSMVFKPGDSKASSVPGSRILWTEYVVTEGSPTDSIVKSVIKLEGVVEQLKGKKGTAKKALEDQMRGVVSAVLDLQTLGQGAMVTHWNALGKTPKLKKMRDKYMSLFRQLIEENYMEQARKYIGGKYQITFTSEDTQSKKPMVKAKIKKTDVDVLVEFDVLKQEGGWKVQDIRLDTTSLEATYRSSFNRLIKKKGGLDSGFPELLKSMEKRLAELRSGKAESL